ATSSTVPTVGNTKCVPSGVGGLGLTCTGTYGTDPATGTTNTAYNPWTGRNLPASEPPTVTISQARDLTDQDVEVSWKNFTPALDGSLHSPNPGPTPKVFYPVSIFECKGTNPDFSGGADPLSDCYTLAAGTANSAWGTNGPPNALLARTQDADAPPT